MRLLAVFAVLLGILAMHGLASGHHSPASAAGPAAATDQPDDAAAADSHQGAMHAAPAQQPTGPSAAPADPSCDGDCGALMLLCVAVLAVTLALAVAIAAVQRRRRTVASFADDAVVARAGARTALPPPDPVRELCVSRT